MKNKKLLTFEDLYSFFVCQNKTFNFNSSDTGYNIAVQVPASFECENEEDDGFLHVRFKVNHILANRNGSYISEESQLDALPSLHYRPVLAAYTTIDEDGTLDFTTHEIEYDKDGNPTYIEQPIGTFVNPDGYHLEYDEKQDKTYVVADAVIYNDYCAPACEIIQRKNGTDVSCELIISELSYNADQKVLNLDKFRYNGVTCLGTNPVTKKKVEPGMEGARLDIADFSEEKNSVFYHREDEIIGLLHSLQDTLAKFEDKENSKKGGNDKLKLKELLEKYGKTEADLDFEYSSLSDEELEAKFSELFDDTNKKPETPNEPENFEGDPKPEGELENPELANTFSINKKFSKDDSGNVALTYEISHEDIRSALYSLLSIWEETDDEWYYINSVYDDYFVYSNWEDTKIYRQGYTVDGDNVSLADERTELFKEYLTANEKTALENMRNNYANLQQKVKDFEQEKDKEAKEKIFAEEDYLILSDDPDFKALVENSKDFSVDEVRVKADLIFAAHVKKQGQVSKKPEAKQTKVPVNFDYTKDDEYKPYGTLFD